ncbi:MAG: glutamine synthetase [Ktedonobacteraceae bacterium]|nr:glutamine synthetase [Ktedonobacteraceae bacterium]
MDVQDVVNRAAEEQTRLVRFQYCDNGGIIRAKATHTRVLESRMREGIGHSKALTAWTGVETMPDVEGMGPVGEFRLVPDPDTFAILPYVPKAASMMCDMIALDGQPWGGCPRSFLKRMIARLAQQDMRLEASVEHEFYFARQDPVDGSYVPADRSLTYSTTGLDQQADVMEAILSGLEVQGLAIELFHTELGPSQQELSIRHADVLHAADHVCLARETIRGTASNFDLLATFAPKPFLNEGGSGAHIHFSLWENTGTGKNLLYDPNSPGLLSKTGRYFIGGILRHVRALVALTCGSVNSYSRLLPHHWSSAYAAWGFDNREAAVRVPSPFWGREADSLNLELKCADHSGNPYLSMGGIIAAGLDGMKNQIDPGEPANIDPGNYSDEERRQRGIAPLPTSLGEALDELEKDQVLLDALGPMLATAYIAVKRDEIAFFQDKTPQDVVNQHFYKY